ncbi:DUF1611 domain-containing protein [Amycolatopsis lurida]
MFISDSADSSCKFSYAVRHLAAAPSLTLLGTDAHRPRHGDVVLARVEEIGHHRFLERPDGRRAQLYAGDRVVVALAPRYAPDQFEAELPDGLGPCDLVAAGGIAARVVGKHTRTGRPTRLCPIGLVGDATGAVVNVADVAPVRSASASGAAFTAHVPTVFVVGTAMNSGKTTTACSLVNGLVRAGRTVGAVKITGTGAGGDIWAYRDAGAAEALDFGDAGLATTFRVGLERLTGVARGLHAELTSRGVDAVVVEVADGVLQPETSQLVRDPVIQGLADAWMFAASDAAGAAHGVAWLREAGVTVSAISGLLTASPLSIREAQAALPVPVYSPADLTDPAVATGLLDRAAPVPARASALVEGE